MDLRVIGVLLLIPILDAMLLVIVAGYIGLLPTVAVVVLSALVGLTLVHAEGRHTVRTINRRIARGEVPTDELLDGALLLVAGALLLTPGLVTDAVGFLLVLPPTRYPIRLAVRRWVVTPYLDARTRGLATGRVYTRGFPGGEAGGNGGTYDVDEDAFEVEFDDGDRR